MHQPRRVYKPRAVGLRRTFCRIPDALRDRRRLHILHVLIERILALVVLRLLPMQSSLAKILCKCALILRRHDILLLTKHRAIALLRRPLLRHRRRLYRIRRRGCALHTPCFYEPTICAGADHRAVFFLLFLHRRRCLDKSSHLVLLIGIPVLLEQFLHFRFLFACHHRPSLV